MSLHLVFSAAGFKAGTARSSDEDVMVLLGDATYTASRENLSEHLLVLEEDALVRGIDVDKTFLIDYSRLVELVSSHSPIVSWHD